MKNLGAMGDAGAVTTNNLSIAKCIKEIRNHGQSKKFEVQQVGWNARMDTIHAEVLYKKLVHLDKWNAKRKQIAQWYNDEFSDYLQVPYPNQHSYHVYHQYVIRSPRMLAIKDYLIKNGIQARTYCPTPLHLTLPYKQKGKFLNTENASATGVAIGAGSGELDLTTTGTLDVNANALDMDLTDSSSITITSSEAAEDLTIEQVGGNDSSIIIQAAGTGSDAIKIDATAGDMLIAPSLANGKTLKIGPNGATEMVFTPHGTAASEKISLTNTAGTADDAISIVATAGGVTVQAGNDSLVLDADGTDADAINIDSAGGIDIDAAGDVDINADSLTVVTDAATFTSSDSNEPLFVIKNTNSILLNNLFFFALFNEFSYQAVWISSNLL